MNCLDHVTLESNLRYMRVLQSDPTPLSQDGSLTMGNIQKMARYLWSLYLWNSYILLWYSYTPARFVGGGIRISCCLLQEVCLYYLLHFYIILKCLVSGYPWSRRMIHSVYLIFVNKYNIICNHYIFLIL